MTSGPGSSGPVEQPVLNGKAGGSNPPRGSMYLYAVVRNELTGGALLAQTGHALTECLRPEDVPLPKDTRIVVLGGSKYQLEVVAEDLTRAGIPFCTVVETDGPLAGSTTAVGLYTRDRDALKMASSTLAALRPWRAPK